MPENELPPIAYSELIAQLGEPDSDLERYLRYMVEVQAPGSMAPELEPNPALVTGIPPRPEGGVAIGLANSFMRDRRHKAYRRRIAGGWTGHRIVSEGDSWFQYPTTLQDTIDHLMKDHAILSLGAAGDELSDMAARREYLMRIEAENASALLLSAGGNDLFDKGQMGRLIETPFPGADASDLVGPTFETFLRDIGGRYLALLRTVHRAFPHVHILMHGYGPAFPRGGAWIARPLDRRGVPTSVQIQLVRLILARFNAMLAGLARRGEFHGKVAHIDVTDIGTRPTDWHDEIHLDGASYARVAQKFRVELARRLGAGARPESGIAPDDAPTGTEDIALQASRLAAFDGPTLLRELDLRVRLLDLDAGAADEVALAPLVLSAPAPEIGLASIRRDTRRLIDRWLADLQDVICGEAPDNPVETAIVAAIEKGRAALAGAIAGWLVTGPLAVPAMLAGALAAWLAGEVLEAGKATLCERWGRGPHAPAAIGAATESTAPTTMGELRARFDRPGGRAAFDEARIEETLDRLDADLATRVVEPPTVPVDADGARHFRDNAATILRKLGGEPDDAPVPDRELGVAEAIILRDGTRPALYVRDGAFDLADPLLAASGWTDRVTDDRADIHRLIAATGRVIRGSDRSADSVYGTAWMLDDGRVATAQHVLEAMAIPVGDDWILNGSYFVDFAVEAGRDPRPDALFRIEAIDRASPDMIAGRVDPAQLDVATFRLAPRDDGPFPEPVPLAGDGDADAVLAQQWFYNVGHPAQPRGPWLSDAEDGNPNTVSRALVFALIGEHFGVKRFSPGKIEMEPGRFPGDDRAHVFTHDATTLGGSSGSGIMSKGPDGAVMTGLHYAGLFGTRNYAHWVPAIRGRLT